MRLFVLLSLLGRLAWAEPLVIKRVTVIDATGKPAQPEMTVVIAGDRIAAISPWKKAKVPRGAQVVDGTGKFLIPGFSLHDELALLVEAGLSPMAALQASTSNAARFMGQLDRRGTIETGKIADLVLLGKDPLADIHNALHPSDCAQRQAHAACRARRDAGRGGSIGGKVNAYR